MPNHLGSRGAPKGNKNAVKAKLWRDSILKALDEYESDTVQRGQALFRIAQVVVSNALAGDYKAIEEIGNRVEGKPVQAIVGDDDEAPIRVEGRIRLVRPE